MKLKSIIKKRGKTLSQTAKILDIGDRNFYYKIKKNNWKVNEIMKLCLFLEVDFNDVDEFTNSAYRKMIK